MDESVQAVHAYGKDIEVPVNFAYFGVDNGGLSQEIVWRIGLVHGVMESLNTSIWRSWYLCKRMKIQIFKRLLRETDSRPITSSVHQRQLWLYGHVARYLEADPTSM